KPLASELVRIGITGAGISLDSLNSKKHDAFRGLPGAWEATMKGIEACKEAGLEFQIHTTVNKDNLDEIDSIIEYSHKAGAKVFNLFFLVCTGRGEKFTDISPPQYESTLRRMVDMQGKYEGMLIRARCAPYFKRIAYQKDPLSPLTKAAGYMGGGCLAGTFYCRIAPNGDVTPCPYMTVSDGNIKKESFSSIWDNSSVLKKFRNPDLGGKCGVCEYRLLCGGCRARPYSATSDFLGEDSWCLYKPKGGKQIGIDSAACKPDAYLVWDGKARERLARIPFFLRGMVEKGVERYAREKGTNLVTPELMEELRAKRFGTEKPIFKI
ncbi:MAG: SPASM domain-containing protein, partial [Nitrospirota bacterium]